MEYVSERAAGATARQLRPSDLAGIELRHAIPGRVRLRIPAIRRDPDLCREVQRQLAALPVIRRVEVNPVTGSVLLLYDPADSAEMAQLAQAMVPGLELDAMPGPRNLDRPDHLGFAAPAEAVAEFSRRLNERVAAATGHAADLNFLVPASLVVGGLVRLIASKQVPGPTWYDFLWFAFGTYFTLNRDRIGDADAMPARPRRRRTRPLPDR